MVEGILTYSSIHYKQQEIESINLNHILQNIEADLELIIQSKNARLKYEQLPIVQGAPFLIYQLFYNLINNSLKLTQKD